MWKYVVGTVAVLPFLRQYFNGPVCKLKRDLSQKIAIVTGANTGIGKETACQLAEMGATIILACRSKARTQQLLNELQGKYSESKIFFYRLDLSDLQSVREFVATISQNFNRIDFIINNAGLLSTQRQVTPQNIELQFATNYLGHFALTLALKPLLLKSREARVINVSSEAHRSSFLMSQIGKIYWHDINFEREKYEKFTVYSQSKLANVLFAKQLQKVLDQETQAKNLPRIKSVSLHPGAVMTEIFRDSKSMQVGPFKYLFFKDTFHGTQTTLQCVLEDFGTLVPGGYYSDCVLNKSSPESNDPANAERLWFLSLDLVRQKGFGDLVEGY